MPYIDSTIYDNATYTRLDLEHRKVSRDTLDEMILSGAVVTIETAGKPMRFLGSEINAYWKANRKKQTA